MKERPNKIAHRLGYWTSRRHEDYQARDGLSRDSDWSRKLKRPRMAMVADIEEERAGKKRITVSPKEEEDEEDINLTFVIKQDVRSEVSFPQDKDLVFRVQNEDYEESREDSSSPESEDLSENNNSNNQYKPQERKFYFRNHQGHNSASLSEDEEGMMDVDDNNDIEEALYTVKDQEEQPKEGPSDTKVREEQNDFSESVLEKIAALKRIDEKLLNIEKEKGRRLKTALNSKSKEHRNYHSTKKRSKHPSVAQSNRKKANSSSRELSSSSSISSSDSSSSSSSNEESSSDNEERFKKNASVGEADDLRNKLKLYLTKLKKKKGVKKAAKSSSG